MSTRKPSLPQELPAATTGGRLATVLSAGLGRLDVDTNNDIKRKQASTAWPFAQNQFTDEQKLRFFNDKLHDYQSDGNRPYVTNQLVDTGYKTIEQRQGETVFVRNLLRVDQQFVWKDGYNGQVGKWVANPRFGQRMNFLDIYQELEDHTSAQHGEVAAAMRMKRREMTERWFLVSFGAIPNWDDTQTERNQITRIIGVNGQDE